MVVTVVRRMVVPVVPTAVVVVVTSAIMRVVVVVWDGSGVGSVVVCGCTLVVEVAVVCGMVERVVWVVLTVGRTVVTVVTSATVVP